MISISDQTDELANGTTKDIVSSWKRSQQYRIDPEMNILPIVSGKLISNFFHKSLEDLDISFYEVFNHFLMCNSSAVFFTDLELNVFMQDGNENILKHLNAINLGIGTNLSEELIGTNAVALAAASKNKSYVAGPEHYLNLLKRYACAASPIFISDNVPIAYVMYVFNAGIFDHTLQQRLDQFIDLQNNLFSLAFNNLELLIKQKTLELGINSQESGTIFINESGVIISVNTWLLDNFNLKQGDVLGKKLDQPFPELVQALDCPGSDRLAVQKEVVVHHGLGGSKKLLAESRLLKTSGGINGTLVSLYETKQPTKVTIKKTVSDAHYTFADLIGIDPIFKEAKNIAEVASLSNCNVMIIGESGSGKELFAQSIHNRSNRKNEPFVSINCAAIPKDLIYSELFGYVEGAFTGAKKGGAPGKFELANKGTLFLDEISEIPNEMQAVLLRVLEEDCVSRLGSSVSIPTDVRVIAATNRDICKSVASDDFRLDLYHRLSVVRIDISPLRRRKDDIPVLADYFLNVFNHKHGKSIVRIAPEAIEYMQNCVWLGNVRELRNVIERGVIFCTSSELNLTDLPKELSKHHRAKLESNVKESIIGDPALQKLLQEKVDEKKSIELLLEKHNNNKTLVAQELGITRSTLYRRLKLLGIE